ncbi:zinc ribbon domain-containing protein [Streptomyces sp. NPDC002187]|uniref:zinc ribbon domain-containing protein n=1 Tax=Streptomyces sp. NPDC002187 TaxID=3364637 RepID=UPI00368B6505
MLQLLDPAAQQFLRPHDIEEQALGLDRRKSAGREVIAVDPRNTSRRCPECGHTAKENRPTQDTFHCTACDHQAHAGTVGALNVLRAGLARRNARPA